MQRTFTLSMPDAQLACTEVGAGPLVLLLHAGGEDRRVWPPVAARLANAGYRSVAVDQRGHGESRGPQGSTDRLSGFVDDANALLSELRAPAVLVGASLGGFVSLLADPKHVAAIIMVDVVPDPEPAPVRAYLRWLEAQKGPALAWNWQLVEDILAQREGLCRAAASAAAPIALVRGESGVLREADVVRFAELVPSLTVRSIEGAGHLVAREQPARLGNALLELFDTLPLQGWRSR